MKKINVIKIGNMVKISLGGKLFNKNCGTSLEADELFRLTLKAKEDPTEENMLAVRGFINEKTRVAIMAGLEHDPETGNVFLAGFNTPIPDTLVEIIKEYHENDYPMDAIINFWKLLMLNPDPRIRTVLFDFITSHDFVLTDEGYMVVYKAVYDVEIEEPVDTSFSEFVSNRYLHVKKEWKCSPNKYVVYKDSEGEFAITKTKTAENWDVTKKGVEILGKLGELFDAIFNSEVEKDEENDVAVPMYTDMYSKKMEIKLGVPVQLTRPECDANFRVDCSNGLHVGATNYVEKFANWHSDKKSILVCYVNPMNVVAVPQSDHSKMRVCEYFPFAIASWDGKNIDVIEQKYFESDYTEFEAKELEALVTKVRANELPIEQAMNAEDEKRPMSELMKIIESRLIDIE